MKEKQFSLCGNLHTWINLQDFGYVFKADILLDILQKNYRQLVIYIDDTDELEKVVNKLSENHFEYQIITSRKTPIDQSKQIHIVHGFIRYELNYSINIIINYNVDKINDIKLYTERVGRTGCYGKKGLVINFVTEPKLFNQILTSNELTVQLLKEKFLDDF